MGFIQFWKRILGIRDRGTGSVVGINSPLWESTFGRSIYKSDLVLACVHAIAEECSKIVVRSVVVKDDTVTSQNDDVSRLFRRRPNPLMSTKDLLYWTAYRLEVCQNAYLFPEMEVVRYADGHETRRVTAVYPIDSLSEAMAFDDQRGEYMITFYMKTGEVYTIPYDQVVHLRKHFGSESMFFGKADRDDLLKTIQTSDLVTELTPKSIQASMSTKGVLTAKALSDVAGLKEFKKSFEETMRSGDTAISVLDVAGSFTPINISPQIVDKDLLEYLDNKILKVFGVPMSVLFGNASENDWSSLYQKNIEPFKIELEQALTACLFTQREQDIGHEIRCYDKLAQHYTIQTRLSIIKELGSRNYLSRSEQRELAGYEPDGGPEKVSLNFVDQSKANQYQLGEQEDEEEQQDE